MRYSFVGYALAIGALWSTAAAQAQDATSYQINPQHTGATVFPDGLKLPLRKLWSRNMGGLVTYPLVVGDFVLASVGNVGSYGSVFYALDRATGATVWSQPISGTYFDSLAAYDSGKIFGNYPVDVPNHMM